MSEPHTFRLTIQAIDNHGLTYQVLRGDTQVARGSLDDCRSFVQGYIKALVDVGNVVVHTPQLRGRVQTYSATWHGALM